jgi:hypothetical protein
VQMERITHSRCYGTIIWTNRETIGNSIVSEEIVLNFDTQTAPNQQGLFVSQARIVSNLWDGEFVLGTCYSSFIDITLISDSEINITGGIISLRYSDENGDTKLGEFNINTASIKLSLDKKECRFTAFDNVIKLDAACTTDFKLQPKTALNAIAEACNTCGVTFSPSDLFFINEDYNLDFSGDEVQTYRDAVTFAARVLGCYCRCSEEGVLQIGPLPQPHDNSLTVKEITRDMAVNRYYISDTNVIFRYATGYVGTDVKNYSGSAGDNQPQFTGAGYEIPFNPVLQFSGKMLIDQINRNIVELYDTRTLRDCEVWIFDGAKINITDCIKIEGKRTIVTSKVWNFRKPTIIKCTAPPVVSALPDIENSDGSTEVSGVFTGVKNLITKRIDGVKNTIMKFAENFESFPETGTENVQYVDKTSNTVWRWQPEVQSALTASETPAVHGEYVQIGGGNSVTVNSPTTIVLTENVGQLLLHTYETVEISCGNKAVYNNQQTDFVSNGYHIYFNEPDPQNPLIQYSEVTLPCLNVSYVQPGGSTVALYCDYDHPAIIKIRYVSSSSNSINYALDIIGCTNDTYTTPKTYTLKIEDYNLINSDVGIVLFRRGNITAADANSAMPYCDLQIGFRAKNSNGVWVFEKRIYNPYVTRWETWANKVPFATIAEFNAAVGLTITQAAPSFTVDETITEMN